MKKCLLILGLALASVSCFLTQAQTWTAPTLTGSTLTTGTTYYVYNVGSNGYLNRGGWWAMMSVVTASPTANASADIIKWTAVNTSGSNWTFQYNVAGSDVPDNYIFAENPNPSDGGVFTDGNTTRDITWNVVLTDATEKTYSIQVLSTYAGYISTQYLGSASATEWTNSGTAGVYTVRYNRAGGDNYTQWKFVSQADLDLYNARVLLDRYMNYAKTRGDIDISTYITTYDAGVTADINTAATNLLTALGRTDVTSSITNPSFEDDASQTGWTNSGSFANATNDPLFAKDGTNYTEKYTGTSIGSVGNLGSGTITQTISGLTNGLYGLVATGHAVQQAGGNPLHTGAFFTAGTSSTEISSGGDYNVDYANVTDGTLTIGYALSGTVGCNWTGFDNFRLYYYGAIVTPVLTASASSFAFDDVFSSDSFTVTGLNLTDAITLTAPSGITLRTYSIPANPTDSSITVTYDGSTVVNGNITLTSGSNVVNIPVTASSNAGCYTPAYPSGNMIADPTFSAATLEVGGFGGWGNMGRSITHTSQYCGRGAAYILGNCWPDGGSLDRSLNTANGNALMPNTIYRLRAMVNSQASAGKTFQFEIEGVDAGASKKFQIGNTNGWKQFDTTFTTGATVTEHGIYFNSCTNPPAITDTCFIDNYELYAVPIQFSSYSLTYLASGTIKVAVKGINLTNDITISAPANFTTTPSTLAANVNGDSISITYDGLESSSGYVYFTSGTIKDSIHVSGTADPIIVPSVSFLTFDEMNTEGTFSVTAGNLGDSIRFTVPSGYSVSPKALTADANGVTVTVTFDGTAESKGYIVLTSGETSAKVRVIGTLNSTTFTPLYSTGNLIADPYFNSLSTYAGWGAENKSITTDTNEVYSGSRSFKMTGACGASLDYNLTGKMLSNTSYRLKAVVKTTGAFKFIVNGCDLDGSNDYYIGVNTNETWQTIDTTFTTGTLAVDQNLYFNSCEGYDGTLAYIDNYELYEVESTDQSISVNPTSLSFIGEETKTFTVTGVNLSESISITAPTGFSVSPSTLDATASDETVSVTYDGINNSEGYIYLISGTVKDSVAVSGTAVNSEIATVNTDPSHVVFIRNGFINVTFELAQDTDIEFSVFSTDSRLLLKQQGKYVAGANNAVLDVNLSSGIYIVNIARDGKLFNYKLINK